MTFGSTPMGPGGTSLMSICLRKPARSLAFLALSHCFKAFSRPHATLGGGAVELSEVLAVHSQAFEPRAWQLRPGLGRGTCEAQNIVTWSTAHEAPAASLACALRIGWLAAAVGEALPIDIFARATVQRLHGCLRST